MVPFRRRERRNTHSVVGGAPNVLDISSVSRVEDTHNWEHWARALNVPPYMFIREADVPSKLSKFPGTER